MNEELIAPCGMNCAICSAYLAYKNQLDKKKSRIPHCSGCRIRNKQCAYITKDCIGNKLIQGKVKYCYECQDYPCGRLQKLDKRYRTRYGMSMLENSQEIKNKGMATFLNNQSQKYACPKCGNYISVHSKKCFVCDEIHSFKD